MRPRCVPTRCSLIADDTGVHKLSTETRARCFVGLRLIIFMPPPSGGGIKQYTAIRPSFRLSVPWRSCLGYRHAGCLQLSQRRPPEMCGLRTRPRTDVDPPRFLPPSNCHRWEAYRLAAPGAIHCLCSVAYTSLFSFMTIRKKVKFSHTRYRALGLELIPVYRQSAHR